MSKSKKMLRRLAIAAGAIACTATPALATTPAFTLDWDALGIQVDTTTLLAVLGGIIALGLTIRSVMVGGGVAGRLLNRLRGGARS